MATKDTTDDYYHKSTSGIGASFSGGMASVGYQSNKQTDTSKTTTWTSSEISAGNNLTTVSGGSSSFTGTDLSAGNDLNISGSSVTFDTVHNTIDQTHKESSVFGGLKVGLASDSVAGQAAQYGQAAADTNGKGSAAGKTLNAMQAGYAVGNGIATNGTKSNGGLASVVVQAGFDKSKSKSEYSQNNVVGSSATAGNNLSIVARGDNASDVHNGDLTAIAADLSGKNVNLSGNNVTLQSDWDTTHSSSKGSSFGGSLGYEFGDSIAAFGGSGSVSKQHANGDSATAVNTNVSATDKVTITAPGKTTINGAIVSGNQITVDTGNLEITSPQDSSTYHSDTSQGGFSAKVSVPGAGTGWGAGGNYANQNIKNNYKSTGDALSGLYAGDGGISVNVKDTTHLKAGVISSTADADRNTFNTGKLIAESVDNQSKWSATATGGGLNLGTGMMGGTLGPLGVVAGNLASNSGLITGGNRKQDKTSTSQSAITGNITINAGSTEGSYATDINNANGHLDNNFDADKLSNDLKNSQLGMQLVGEVMGQISDALHDNGVPGFDETKLSNDWGRILLEAAGSAGVAGTTGGNVGAATGSSIAGNIATASTVNTVAQWAMKQSNGDEKLTTLLTNAIENAFASMGGAAAGVVTGGSSGAMNGGGISSDLQQYNQAQSAQLMRLIAGGGLLLGGQQAGQSVDLDQVITDLINAIHNPFANYGQDQAEAMANTLMGMAMMAQAAPELYNQLTQYASQSAEQYGQYIDLMKQLGATIYGASKNNEVAKGQEQSSGTTTAAGGAPSPDNNNDDDQDDKSPTKYESNDAHNPKSGKYNPNKTIEPSDAKNVFLDNLKNGNLIKGSEGNWYAVGKEGVYRFAAKNTDTAHFNGIMSKQEIFKDIGREGFNAVVKQMGEAAAKKWK